MNARKRGGRFFPIAGLILLCVLWAVSTLQPELLPLSGAGSLPPLVSQAIALLVFAAIECALAVWKRNSPPRGHKVRRTVVVGFWLGVSLFVAPALLIHSSQGWIEGETRMALFTLVPLFAQVLEPYVTIDGSSTMPPIRFGFAAALCGVIGTLFVIPVGFPESGSALAAFVAVIVSAICVAGASCYAVLVARRFNHPSFAAVAATAALSGAACLFSTNLIFQKTTWTVRALDMKNLGLIALDVISLVILFWVITRLTAVQVSTRYVLAPVLAISIGALLTQASLLVRTGCGLALMLGSTAWLLFAGEETLQKDGLTLL